MKALKRTISALALASLLLGLQPWAALADDAIEIPGFGTFETDSNESEELYTAAEEEEEAESSSDPWANLSPETARNAYLLLRLRQYLSHAQESYQSLEEKMEETRAEIENNRYAIEDLEGQIAHLEDLITETEDKIYNAEVQIAEKEVDIQNSLETIAFTQVQIEEQKNTLSSYLRLLYFEKNLYFDALNQPNGVKILLQSDTVSKTLQSGTYISFMEEQSEELVDELESLERSLKRENYDLTVKYEQLSDLRDELDAEQRNLSAQLEGKNNLLNEVLVNDEIYRELFASYALAQEAILNEINLFQSNLELLDSRISSSAAYLSPQELALIEQIKSDAELEFDIREAADFLDLSWPVMPKQGLSAFFEDDGYVATFGVQHHALDIPVAHGSPIYAPADGVAYFVYDAAALEDEQARLGYGYLIIAHQKGVMTLYGHISASLVQEGDFVHSGQIIALSGATPGTPGAGGRTTGAHLHFEVIQDGVRVDPMEYLPLEEVPLDSLPEYYLDLLQEQLEEALSESGESVDLDQLQDEMDEDLYGSFEVGEVDSLLPYSDEDEATGFWTQGQVESYDDL